MKKIMVLLFAVFFITGCQIVRTDNLSIDEITNKVLNEKIKMNNMSLEGYKYYLPKGISLKSKTDRNSILYYNKSKIYLYVDIISYYNKVDNTYSTNEKGFYSKEIKIGNKKGYLEINKVYNKYFIEFMYNFAKIEAYVEYEDINNIVLNSAIILNSIKYNELIIGSLIGSNNLNYNEEVYDIFTSKRETGNFLDYVEQYGTYEDTSGELPDENSIEIEETE
ncbi:MAG: hypothetical protein PHQ64_01655 [Bacilli bacterium]|nr:hypothetical protein [Bacilli bacterium]